MQKRMLGYLVFSIVCCLTFSLLAETKFSDKENCADEKGQAEAAKAAALAACKWISEIGKGDKSDTAKAFGKINEARFCDGNYVWIEKYFADGNKTNHNDEQVMLLHPAKPGLETAKDLFHKDFYGYAIFEQFNKSATDKPAGCWVPYKWTKPGVEGAVEKISYIVRCKDKDSGEEVVAGAGIYAPHKSIPTKEQCATDPHPYGR